MGGQGKWNIRLPELEQGKSREGPFSRQRRALGVLMNFKASGVLDRLFAISPDGGL